MIERTAENEIARVKARLEHELVDQAEATLAALEGGARALVFSSGMSAATACFLALAPGDHVVNLADRHSDAAKTVRVEQLRSGEVRTLVGMTLADDLP